MEYEKDALISVTISNRHTNSTVGMDFLVKKEILNSVMKEKVHKEFDALLKDTADKLSTAKNINKIVYG